MKRFSFIAIALAASVTAAPAFAAKPASCDAIEARIAARSREFVKLTNASYVPARPQPAELYQGARKKDVRLQETADELWNLRSEMVNRKCPQASAFTY